MVYEWDTKYRVNNNKRHGFEIRASGTVGIKNKITIKIKNRMNTLKIITLTIIFSLLTNIKIIAQYCRHLDTLKITEFKSEKLPIFSTKEFLIEMLGMYDKSTEIETTICDSMVKCKPIKTEISANLLYYREKHFDYIEKDNKVRLSRVDFEYNKSVKIENPQICLSRDLKMKEMLKAFKLSLKKNVSIIKRPFYPPWNNASGEVEKAYYISFLTGESNCTTIDVYFDNKKKLRYIDIAVYYF